MEACSTFKPWHNKSSGKTFLKPDQSKCLHYYFYLMDEELGRGFQNKSLRRHLTAKTMAQMSRTPKRLRLHGLIKKIGRTYKYYLTSFGKHVIATGFKLKHLVIIPGLALPSPA